MLVHLLEHKIHSNYRVSKTSHKDTDIFHLYFGRSDQRMRLMHKCKKIKNQTKINTKWSIKVNRKVFLSKLSNIDRF